MNHRNVPEGLSILPHAYFFSNIHHIATVYTRARKGKKPKCPSTGE